MPDTTALYCTTNAAQAFISGWELPMHGAIGLGRGALLLPTQRGVVPSREERSRRG